MSKQTYPAYKPSGMDWVGDIPGHWDVRRMKYTASINDEALSEATNPEFEFTYVDIGSVDAVKGIVTTEIYRFEDAPSRARRIVRDGDTIVSTVRTYLRAIAPIRNPEDNLIVSTGFAVVRPRTLNAGYLSYALRSPFFIETVVSRSTGVSYPAINAPEVGNIGVTIPPLEEQRAIAAFLDRETARLDVLIEKKQRQIKLLQEKRSALISHAVTKGLDPKAKMKDSGVEWLGEIPEHWRVCLFKRVASTSYGVGGEIDRTIIDGTPVLSLPNVDIDGRLLLNDVPLKPLTDSEKRDLLLKKGDLLFNWRNGSSQHLGKTAFFNLEGEYSHVSFLLRLRFDLTKHDSRYFQELLSGFRITGFFSSSKAGVNNTFNQSELDNLWVVVPPKDEQNAIASYLTGEIAKIDSLIGRVEKSNNLLQEHRTALISAAVTGKIDVRKEVS